MGKKDQEIGINFETGEVFRGKSQLMNLDEMLFLLDSAKRYNDMFPIEESQKFMSDLRERIGMGFTSEQFENIKKSWETGEFGIEQD